MNLKLKTLIAIMCLTTFILGCKNTNEKFDKTQNILNKDIDSIINKSLEDIRGIPSISIAIVKDNDIFFQKSYGFSDVENKIKATINTPYYIASTTKSFTGTLAQILADEKVIDLDKSIIAYKPIQNFKNKEIFKNITIRQLLTHTSGISNGYLVWRNGTSAEYTKEKLITILESHTSTLNNNKAFKYDNLGYNILDLILKEEFDLNWKILLNEKIFEPLNMEHTTAYRSVVDKNEWQIAKPYTVIGNTNNPTLVKVNKTDKNMQAAGGLYSSIKDISNWLLFNINKGKLFNKSIHSIETLNKIHQQQTTVNQKGIIFKEKGYGLGWHNALFDNKRVLYHNGGFVGNSARIAFMPNKKVGIAVFANESFYGDNIADLLIKRTFNYFLNKKDSLKPYFEEITSIKEKVKTLNKRYTTILSERVARPNTLTLNTSKYLGNYVNEGFGSISLTSEHGKLTFRMGVLEAKTNYGTKENQLEVELLGPSSNTQIDFIVEKDKVKNLTYKGLIFKKVINK